MKSATKKASLAAEMAFLEHRQQIATQELQFKQLKEEFNLRIKMAMAHAVEKAYSDYLQKLHSSGERSLFEQRVPKSLPASPCTLQGVSSAPPQLPVVTHALSSQLQGVSYAPLQLPVVSHALSSRFQGVSHTPPQLQGVSYAPP